MSAHTPGPWEVSRSGKSVMASDGERVADCRDAEFLSDSVERANARLIAAAPDLLALAREYRALHIASLVLSKDCSCTACAKADDLIARAEGKS